MKLTKLSVLFSSLYFGLVGSSYSSDSAVMTFTETVNPVCGFEVDSTAAGSILFKGEEESREDEDFVTFTPYSNNSGQQTLELTLDRLVSTNLSVTSGSGSASAIGDSLKLWIGEAVSAESTAAFGHDGAKRQGEKITVVHGTSMSAIAAVDHKSSEIEHTGSNATVTATIRLACK
ncbi:hypothetical protein MHN79_14900 [Vibrio sp. Of14-4]|uniref:hypothetical protein n=1 Tax=Vibrio sp. Of14-4 TaxID=2724878 RepID=UPI001EF3BAC3|nr:hypothetical protein [Vibrio sp. Of14-4]MCG7490779.1 hypothetical protein [Vibrio sp. Of14-4]